MIQRQTLLYNSQIHSLFYYTQINTAL